MSRPVTLAARERRVLEAVGDALVPGGEDGLPPASAVRTADSAADLVEERVATPLVWLVRVVVWIFELWPLATHLRPFTRLPPRTQRKVVALADASRNPMRSRQVDLFKHLLVNTYLSDEEVSARVGYRRDAHLQACATRERNDTAIARLHPRTWPDVPDVVRCDVAVIGSGAGGAPVAAALAEAGLDVVVVEEGAYHTPDRFASEPVWQRFLDLYRDLGVTGTLGAPPIPVPFGRAVGGTTVVNAGTCFRAPDRILGRWSREFGLEYDDLDARFDLVEKVQGVAAPPEESLGRNASVFRAGARAMGCEGEVLCRNVNGCRGCGESVAGCPFGAKQAVHLTWLPRAERAGARILARVRVDRVLHRDGHARGLVATVLDPGRRDVPRGQVRIDAEAVVVAAGAFHTPVLLERSGVPDPSGTRGRNLQIHPAIGVAADMPFDVHAWEGVLQSWGVDALAASHGIMIEATAAPPPLSGGQVPGSGWVLKDLLAATPRMATSGFLIEDSTTGRVTRGPVGRPLAFYQLTRGDRRRIAVGFSWVAEAFLEAGASRVLVGLPGRRWATGRGDLQRIRDDGVPPEVLKLSAYHPVGTHRMSADPQLGPADAGGGVRGVEGLWVADASALPSCIGVNPQITIMAFALRTADRILDDMSVT